MRKDKLRRQSLKRIYYKNIEFKKIILTSVKNNKNIINTKRAYALFKLIQIKKYNYRGHVESCLLTGKSRGVWKFAHLGRHKINELNKTGDILNIKSSNW